MADYFKRFWWAVAAGLAGLAVILTTLMWPSSSGGRVLPPARARVYAAWRACLVTGAAGLSDPQAASVWAGMEQASAKTSAKVSYLAAVGDGSVGSAETYVASAAGEQCDLVIAVGAAQVQGVALASHQFPKTRFAVVGGVAAADGNVSQISADPSGGLSLSVATVVESAIDAAPLSGTLPAAPSTSARPTATAS